MGICHLKCFIVITWETLELQETHIMLNLREPCVSAFYLLFHTDISHLKKWTSSKNIMQERVSKGLYLICPLHTFWGNINVLGQFLRDTCLSCSLHTDLVTEFLPPAHLHQTVFVALTWKYIHWKLKGLHLIFSGCGEYDCSLCKTVCVFSKLW